MSSWISSESESEPPRYYFGVGILSALIRSQHYRLVLFCVSELCRLVKHFIIFGQIFSGIFPSGGIPAGSCHGQMLIYQFL